VVLDDLHCDLQAEDMQVCVGLSVLEQVQLLRRWQDVPRTLSLHLRRDVAGDQSDWVAFCHATGLQPGHSIVCDPLEIAQKAGLDFRQTEQQVLAWAEAGYLECRASARDLLLELLPAPKDTRERLHTLLERHERVQGQRIAEIVAYARTRRCRHGHISAYFGGKALQKCAACDNCLGAMPKPARGNVADECEQLQIILQAAAHGWGRRDLILILRGQPDAPAVVHAQATFGALRVRSEGALGKMIDRLLAADLLHQHRLEHGGVMVEPTPAGRQALADPSVLRAGLAKPTAQHKSRGRDLKDSAGLHERASVEDGELFKRLAAWRLNKALESDIKPFLVAHNALLHALATLRPQNDAELLAVPGMGPVKMAKYGRELLNLVRGSLQL